jgi:hypothetical protein
MLVSGSLESLSSRTTSVLVSKAGNMRVNFIIWPGNHDGGIGSAGNGMRVRAMVTEWELRGLQQALLLCELKRESAASGDGR